MKKVSDAGLGSIFVLGRERSLKSRRVSVVTTGPHEVDQGVDTIKAKNSLPFFVIIEKPGVI